MFTFSNATLQMIGTAAFVLVFAIGLVFAIKEAKKQRKTTALN